MAFLQIVLKFDHENPAKAVEQVARSSGYFRNMVEEHMVDHNLRIYLCYVQLIPCSQL